MIALVFFHLTSRSDLRLACHKILHDKPFNCLCTKQRESQFSVTMFYGLDCPCFPIDFLISLAFSTLLRGHTFVCLVTQSCITSLLVVSARNRKSLSNLSQSSTGLTVHVSIDFSALFGVSTHYLEVSPSFGLSRNLA